MEKKKYRYEGPVMCQDYCIEEKWEGVTSAVTEKKAKSNLIYRWKKQHGYAPIFPISLPQSLVIIE